VVIVRVVGIGYLLIITAYEKFEDSNRVIRCRISKDWQYNSQKLKKNGKQDRTTRTPLH